MFWDAEPPDRPGGAPAGDANGPGWLPARAQQPVVLLAGVLLLALGVSGWHPADGEPGLLSNPPSIRIDLNRDPPERLTLIPGIGPRRARAIVESRDQGGPFAAARDLLRVPGIGPGLMHRLAPFLPRVGSEAGEPTRSTVAP